MPDVGRNSPFLLFMTAVILTSWFGGFIAGITLSILSAVLVSFILITPFGILNDHPIMSVEAGLFVAECFFISIFVEFVKKTLEEVSLDQRLLDVLLSSTSTYGVVLLNDKYIVVGWSKGAQKLIGYTKEEIMGKPITILCDKKNWYGKNTESLQVRVRTQHIISPVTKYSMYIKIINSIPKKRLLPLSENTPTPSPFSSQVTQTPQLA
jgi:hypothetical protein